MCFVGVGDQGLGVGLKFKSVHLKAFHIQKHNSSVQSQRTPVAIVYFICFGVLQILRKKKSILHMF